ncbi:MAG: TRAP transporter substrate-binding protein DctP [bacterium]
MRNFILSSHHFINTLFMVFTLLVPLSVYSKTLIRFATLAPEGTAWMETMHKMDEELRERTGGEIGFRFYPNMTMGDEKDVIRKIRLGQLQGAGFTGFGLGEILPEVRVLELPYLFRSDEEIEYVRKVLDSYFQKRFEEKGFILLGWADVGWIYFFSRQPVVRPADLKKIKPWAWQGDPLAEAFFIELGKPPVFLPVTDVHLALQTGMVEAVYASPLACLALQWFMRINYVSDVPFTNSLGAVLVSRQLYLDLSPQHQEALREIVHRHLIELLNTSRRQNEEAYLKLQKEGVKVAHSTFDQRAEMEAIGLKVHSRLAGQLYPEELLKQVKTILQDFREKKEQTIESK